MGWTDELIARVVQLWHKDGWTATEIGELIGKSRNAILGKLNRLGHVGDGSHQAGIGGHKPRVKKFAPPKEPTPRSRAKGAGLVLTSLGAVPPPHIPKVNGHSSWDGIAGAIDSLQTGECRWPLPDTLTAAIGFCGAPVASERVSYCPHHLYRALDRVPEVYRGRNRN
jgi:hypothetical protein